MVAGSCEILRFPAFFHKNLRCPAVLQESSLGPKCCSYREKARISKICENRRITANLAPFVPFSLSLFILLKFEFPLTKTSCDARISDTSCFLTRRLLNLAKSRDAEMTTNIMFERSSQKGLDRGFEKRVNRGPTLKFYCRPKAQEQRHFGKSHFNCRRFFPGNTVTIILDNYPPSTLQGVGLGGRKNPRTIVGENSCHFGASYKRKIISLDGFPAQFRLVIMTFCLWARATYMLLRCPSHNSAPPKKGEKYW